VTFISPFLWNEILLAVIEIFPIFGAILLRKNPFFTPSFQVVFFYWVVSEVEEICLQLQHLKAATNHV